MHRGTRGALSFRSSVHSAVGLLRGTVVHLLSLVALSEAVSAVPRFLVAFFGDQTKELAL